MKRIGIIAVALGFFGTVCADEYQDMLGQRNQRLEKKVAEEVGKQVREMRTRIRSMQSRIDGMKKKAAPTFEAVSDGEAAPWLFNSFNAWKDFLKERPEVTYLREPAEEELDLRVSYDWGHRAFDDHGHTQDPAHLAFGHSSFALKDALVASRLLQQTKASKPKSDNGSTDIPANHYLYILNNQQLTFDSSRNKEVFDFSYHRTFFDKKFELRVSMPLVRVEHKMQLATTAEISGNNRELLQLAQTNKFYSSYDHMSDFITKTLANHGVAFGKTQEEWGIGDFRVDGSYKCDLNYTDETRVGGSLILGTGKVRRNVAVWEPQLGNEGASRLEVNGLVAWHRGEYANPYVTATIGYNFPVQVVRRAPFSLSYAGNSAAESFTGKFPSSISFANDLELNGQPFTNQSETLVRDFASHPQKVTMYKGFEGRLRIGNRCERCFDSPFFTDVSYELFIAESKDHSKFDTFGTYDKSVLNLNTSRIGHTLDLKAGYRFNDACVLRGEFSYRFAGRNMMANYHTGVGLHISF